MNKTQQKRFDALYTQHLNALKRQGKSDSTIAAYALAIRRITQRLDRCPDKLSQADLEAYFSDLLTTHSWSTIKRDRCGLQFFYKHVAKKQWVWVNIVKPPKVKSLPDILTLEEIAHVINTTRELRYQTYILTTYSMGLRLGEALTLQVGDIDAKRMLVHIRNGKGGKDRFVMLPQTSLVALRRYWATHRHPRFVFPGGTSTAARHKASSPMDRGGLQKSFRVIIADCGIHKKISIHSLRHCFGAHLNEAGVPLQAIQQAMGHECIRTTALYSQLTMSAQQENVGVINQLIERLPLRWCDRE